MISDKGNSHQVAANVLQSHLLEQKPDEHSLESTA